MDKSGLLNQAIELAGRNIGNFALRVIPDDMDPPRVGDILQPSFVWRETKDGEMKRTNRRAAGTSSIGIDDPAAAEQIENYFGNYIVLLEGKPIKNSSSQFMAGEKVLKSPRVIAVWFREDILKGPYTVVND